MSDVVFRKVAELVAARVHISPDEVSIDSTFADLGVDSLGAVSLIYDLEDEFGIEIPNEVAMNVQTVRQVVESLGRLGVE
jgi:acyl carrier protein